MTEPATVIALSLLGTLLVEAVLTIGFVRLFYRGSRDELPDDCLPVTSVLLPLRGADPKLAVTLRRLLNQDYPRYDVRIVVDSKEDPAWRVVKRLIEETGVSNVDVSWLRERRTRCSPQCSALIQAVEELDGPCDVVVIVDGDVVVHRTWLRELVSPLLEADVGVAHGNRWFHPRDGNWGSLVRYLWNAAAVVFMYWFQIPWAGSFSMRKSVLHESGLFKTWGQSIVPDAPSVGLLKKMGLRVRYVPSVTMINYEKCDLPFAYDFIKRQMTWTRTYHARWIPVFLNAGVVTVLPVFGFVLGVLGMIARRTDAAVWCFIGFAGYSIGTLLLVGLLEHSARKAVRAQGNRLLPLPLAAALRIPFALLITQVVQLAAIIAATFRKTITWRGVTYYIRRPFDVEITKDYPIEQSEEAIKANVSQ